MIALAEEIQVVLGEDRGETIGVFEGDDIAGGVSDRQLVGERGVAALEHALEETLRVDALHGEGLLVLEHVDGLGARLERADGEGRRRSAYGIDGKRVYTEHVEGGAVVAADDGVD